MDSREKKKTTVAISSLTADPVPSSPPHYRHMNRIGSQNRISKTKSIPLSPTVHPIPMSCSVVIPPPASPSPAAVSSPFRLRLGAGLLSPSPPPKASPGGGGRSGVKRKRELRIDVPDVAMGDVLEMPPREEVEELAEDEEGKGYAVCARRGRRRHHMEDHHAAAAGEMAFFGVFDGHGGKRAAQFASQNMGGFIAEEVRSRGEGCSERALEEAVKIGYVKTDEAFLKDMAETGGACCLTALVQNGSVVVSNAGDCRAVLCRDGQAEALTSDHRLDRADERDRVERLGGYVNCSRGVWRLQDSLAVSRGIGDGYLKQWVTPEPETKTVKIKPECEFLILASDGLWDNVSNQEAVDVARPLCTTDGNSSSMLQACRRLVDLSVKRGSLDDVTVMILQLQHFLHKEVS